eukprot:1160481-Pelagomonas_calceolata.AAC.1
MALTVSVGADCKVFSQCKLDPIQRKLLLYRGGTVGCKKWFSFFLFLLLTRKRKRNKPQGSEKERKTTLAEETFLTSMKENESYWLKRAVVPSTTTQEGEGLVGIWRVARSTQSLAHGAFVQGMGSTDSPTHTQTYCVESDFGTLKLFAVHCGVAVRLLAGHWASPAVSRFDWRPPLLL